MDERDDAPAEAPIVRLPKPGDTCGCCGQRPVSAVGMTYCDTCGGSRGRAKLKPLRRKRQTRSRRTIRLPGPQEGELSRG